MNLSDVSKLRPVEGGYQLEVYPGWRQGRGAFGGLVIGALIRAIEQTVSDPRRKIRSVTAEIPAPVELGTSEITVEMLREGKNVSALRAALRQGGETRSHAVAVVGAERAGGDGWNELVRPDVPHWSKLSPLPSEGPWPEFSQHFEMRIVEGVPAEGGASRAIGWLRPRDPGPERGAAYVAAMIDAWWPAAMVKAATLRPTSTIAYTLQIIEGAEGLDPTAPLLYRGTAPVCTAGYSSETRELWSEDGRLVALNYQTFVTI